MIRGLPVLLVIGLLSTATDAQVFERQFAGTDSFDRDDRGRQQQALQTFVGRHAFAASALPVVGFFGCSAQGGGECSSPTAPKSTQSQDRAEENATNSSDAGSHCP